MTKINSTFQENTVVMTAHEAATFLKVSVEVVRRWTREGKLKGNRLGVTGDYRALKTDALRFLNGSS